MIEMDAWFVLCVIVGAVFAAMMDVGGSGPSPGDADSLTRDDERCKAVRLKQGQLAEKMKRQGRHLLSGREYVPALTKPSAVEKPPKADKVVVPIRGRRR